MRDLHSSWLLVLLLTASGAWSCQCSNPAIRGSGTIVTQEREVADFDRVSLAGSGRLEVIQGDEEALSITTDDNLLEHIDSTVTDGRLRIGPHRASLRPTRDVEYVLKVKQIQRLDLSGSLTASAERLEAESLALHISGSGRIRIGHLDAERCETHISGSGRVELAGRAAAQGLRVSGSGQYRAADLESEGADITISGSGNATIWVSDRLDASISGSGSISYYGEPHATQSVSGSGRLRGLGAK